MCTWLRWIWLFVFMVGHGASMTVSQSYKLSDSHEVLLKHWWPALMVHDRFSDCCQVWRWSCPLSLSQTSSGEWESQSGLICTLTLGLFQHSRSHSRMTKYSAVWGWEPAGSSLDYFNFVFLLLPLFSLSVTMFVHSCVHRCDCNSKRSTFARIYVTDRATVSTASMESKMHSICKRLGIICVEVLQVVQLLIITNLNAETRLWACKSSQINSVFVPFYCVGPDNPAPTVPQIMEQV